MKSLLVSAFDIIVGRAPLAFMAADEGLLESLKGIRNARVETINSDMILPRFLEAHEQSGNHMLFLFGASQARMVRQGHTGTKHPYFKDQSGFSDVDRAEKSF